jgi:hypothetical protein
MKVKMEIVLAFLAALFAMYTFPTGYLALTAVATILAYCATESYDAVLGTLVIMIFLRLITTTLEPSKAVVGNYGAVGGPVGGVVSGAVEGFQPKEPISIHQRLEKDKAVAPKVEKIYGVLESPNILDSLQIANVSDEERGAARSTLPATAGAYEPIRTPAEGIVPNISSQDINPRGNPYLQNGPDSVAVDTALVKAGTKLNRSLADHASMSVGGGQAV